MLVSEEEEQKRRVHPLLPLCASLTSLKVCAETLRVLPMTLCDVTKGTNDSTVTTGPPASHMLVPPRGHLCFQSLSKDVEGPTKSQF